MKSRRSIHPRGGKLAGLQGLAALAFVVCLFVLAGCGATSSSWQTLGTSQSNTITSLAQDPTQPKIMYAGAMRGVVYRSRTDIEGMPLGGSGISGSAQVTALLPGLHTAGLVYATTTSGFYVTTDFGDHWSRRGTGLPANEALTSLAFANDGSLRAGTLQHGVYESADQGQTWSQLSAGLPADASIYTLFRDPATRTLFAGLDGGGLYISSDDGQSWTQQTSGIPAQARVYVLTMTSGKGLNPSGPTLYAGADSGLYASIDGGHTWTRQGVGMGLPSGSVRALAADPKAPGTFYAGIATNVYGSTDGGLHWSIVAPGLSRTVTSLLVVVQPDGKTAVFAGAGQLQRFPAAPGGSNPLFSAIFDGIFFLILIGMAYLMLRRWRGQPLRIGTRARRTGASTTHETPARPRASTEPAESSAANENVPSPPARPNDTSGNKFSRPRNRNGGGEHKR